MKNLLEFEEFRYKSPSGFGRLKARAKEFLGIAYNGWVYEKVCLEEMFKFSKMLLANFLIHRVMLSCRLINYKY